MKRRLCFTSMFFNVFLAMNKGFSYTLEDDKILAFMKLSDEEKLKWLEEINEFNALALGKKEKEIREKLRRAEI
ncbi:MAG: hypothetical protein HQM09_05555 [Candidatus Riflebacteria bacterium]|nr:hypothetical protein [Candidatus Riflebacteria bacterium]